MRIDKALAELGLTKNKGTVYIAALEVGSGSVQDIAKKASLPRTTVHEILGYLSARGLIGFVNKGRTRIYTAEPPTKLKKILIEKEELIDDILPELALLFNTKGSKPKVRFYEGIEGIKTVFEDTLTVKNKTLLGILSMEDLYKIPGKRYMDNYVTQRVAAGIKLKVIRSQTKEIEEAWPASTTENRELHYASAEMIFPMTLYLYDNKVSIVGTQKENFGMIIESEDMYRTLKNMFEVMWEVTKVMKKID